MNESIIVSASNTTSELFSIEVIMWGAIIFVVILAAYNIIKRVIHRQEERDFGFDSEEGVTNRIRKPRKLYSKTFNKNKFKELCGVEIECIQNHANLSGGEAEDLHFKKVYDGSLSSNGEEFVSKPANGDKLFNMIDKICKRLNENEYSIDKTCGLHVHIGVPTKLEFVKKLYIFYSKYENLFFKMLPSSRQRNTYCKKIKRTDDFSIKDVKDMKYLHQFKKKYYETNFYALDIHKRYYKKKYCWANFHSLFYRGTLEIRAHSGTINSEKIKKWIIIHLSVIDFIKNKSVEEIYSLPVKKETFMKIFPKDIRKYVESRWGKFKKTEEEYDVPNTAS